MTYRGERFQALVGLMVAMAFGVIGSRAAAQAVGTSAVADTHVKAMLPDANFGTDNSVVVAAPNQPAGEQQGLVRWDLAPVKAEFDARYGAGTWHIEFAAVTLSQAQEAAPPYHPTQQGPFNITWIANDTWDETAVTFRNLPTFLGPNDQPLGQYQFSVGPLNNTRTYGLPLSSSGVTADVLEGRLLSLHFTAAGSPLSYMFQSRSHTQNFLRPRLVVVAVPEPGVASVVMVALCIAAARPARRIAGASKPGNPAGMGFATLACTGAL